MAYHFETSKESNILPSGLGVRKGRRKHKNSKFGCSKCKARKIKCDESLPACLNCERKGIRCPYLTMTPYQVYLVMKSTNSNIDLSIMNENIKSSIFNEYPNQYTVDLSKHQLSDVLSDNTSFTENSEKLQHNNLNGNKIDLRSLNINESIYKATEMEHLLLSLREKKDENEGDAATSYNRLKIPESSNSATDLSISEIKKIIENPSYMNDQFNSKHYSGKLSSSTRVVCKAFTINNKLDYEEEIALSNRFEDAKIAIFSSNFASFFEKYGTLSVDFILRQSFDRIYMLQAQFSKLISSSLLLHSCDYIKNVIIKQPILPDDSYNINLRIAGDCEILSVYYNNNVTSLIKNEYLKLYPFYDVDLVEIFIGSFSILNECLVLHFKSGFKSELSTEESQNSVSKFGTFNAGIFSVAMDTHPMIKSIRAVRIVASFLGLNLKSMLIPSLKPDLLEEMKRRVEKLSTKLSSEGYVLTHYENLKRFLEANAPLVREKMTNSTTLLGVGNDNAYVIRLMNEFFQILPYDLFNLKPGPYVSEEMIVTYLAFIGTAFLLNNIIPGSMFFATNKFTSRSLMFQESTKTEILMQLFKQLTKPEFKDTAIYLIRMITILKQREGEYQAFFNTKEVPELTNPNLNMDLYERCYRLKKMKIEGVMDETPVKSFRLDKATFLERWNVPRDLAYAIPKVKLKEVKIISLLPSLDDKVNNFLLSNNGLFTNDHLVNLSSAANHKVGAVAVKGEQLLPDNISMGWRVSTHIRTNNV